MVKTAGILTFKAARCKKSLLKIMNLQRHQTWKVSEPRLCVVIKCIFFKAAVCFGPDLLRSQILTNAKLYDRLAGDQLRIQQVRTSKRL